MPRNRLARSRRRILLTALGVGLLLGVFSFVGDGRLGGRASVLVGNLASPWGLAAFLVGRLTSRRRLGALAGGVALSVGVASYYALGASAGYATSLGNVAWTVLAVMVGPILGLAGAVSVSASGTTLVIAIAAPSAMLLAEVGFLVLDRRVWLWNFEQEPYRFVDLTVLVTLGVLAFVMPRLIGGGRASLRTVIPMVLLGGAVGSVAFVVLAELLVRITQI